MDLISVDMQLSEIAKQLKLKGQDENIPFIVETQYQTPQQTQLCRLDEIENLRENLPDYAPSKEMLDSLELNFSRESLIVNNPIFADYLEYMQFEFYNACSVMKTLLTIEDMSKMKLYAQLVESNVTIQKAKTRCYSFKLNICDKSINLEDMITTKMDEVVLIPKSSLLASPLPTSILCLMPHRHEKLLKLDPSRRHVATVEQVKGSTIEIYFGKNRCPGDKILLGERYTIIIRPSRIPIRLMYRALDILQQSPLDRLYLFPFPACFTKMIDDDLTQPISRLPFWMRSKVAEEPLPALLNPLCLINEAISSNPEQLMAVERIVAGPSLKGPFIVFGPPGTGKTTTIVEAILQLLLNQRGSKILVTAGSNSACDTIAERLCEYFESTDRMLEQLNQENQIQSQSRVPSIQETTTKPQPKILLRLFSRFKCEKGLNTVSQTLLKYSNCSNGYMHLTPHGVQAYDIVVATLCTVGRLITEYPIFTHIFIDEAGASTEPEALIGIMGIRHSKACHVILSGDHKQLGAVLESNRAGDLGLNRSLMERLLNSDYYKVDDNGNYDRSLQARLRRNYRSHPEIVRLYNTLYYDKELIAQAPIQQFNWNILPNAKFPIIFQATHGKTQKESASTSSYNGLEIQVVCWFVRRLLEDNSVQVEQEDIGIVAPYLAQGRMLTKQLKRQGYDQVEVGTVESYQGREKRIIIVTLVRSFKSIGFMQNPRRINVFLSRAKSLLILVGNPVTLRHNSDFEFLINECKRHGNYLYKKKNTYQRPLFLLDVEDESNEDEKEGLIKDMSKISISKNDICKLN